MLKKFLILFCIICRPVWAEVCDWAKKTPPDDAKYKYFVARTFSEKSYSEAKERAENDITARICDVLGQYVSVGSDGYENLNIDDSFSSSMQRSRCLGIHKENLERVEDDDGKLDGSYVACVKYRYDLKSLKEEKERIKKYGTTNVNFNLIPGETDCDGHPMQITTLPVGAYISIDDKMVYSGYTPIRFGNVCNGSHDLKITMRNYKDENKKISSKDTSIFVEMQRKTKRLTFTANVSGTKFSVFTSDGFVMKSSSNDKLVYDFLIGETYQVKAENPYTEVGIKEFTVSEESENVMFDLKYLPAEIDFTVFKQRNPNVNIYVDGRKVNNSGNLYFMKKLNPYQKYNITFKHNILGYEPIEKTITLSPKEKKSYPSDELKFNKKKSFWSNYRFSNKRPWLWLGMSYDMSNYQKNGLSVPVKDFSVYTNMFMTDTFSFDMKLSLGMSKINSEFGHFSDRVKKSTAANIFSENNLYANFEVSQMLVNFYSGFSWYFPQSENVVPFVSVGYDKALSLGYKIKKYESNFLAKENVEDLTKLDFASVMVSAGLNLSMLSIVGSYSPNCMKISLGFVMPL